MGSPYSAACSFFDGAGSEIFGEMVQRAHHRIGREAAERAQRAELHRVAEVVEHRDCFRARSPAMILSIILDAARRADAAGRALAAGFDGAELHGEARLLRHVDACRRTPRCRHGRSARRGPRRPRSRTACRTARAGNRRRAARRPAPRAPAGPVACRRRYRRQFAERDAERPSRTGRHA